MALILSRADAVRCLNMPEAIEAMRIAFGALSAGQAQAPQRMAVGLTGQGIALLMPSLLQTVEQHAFGLKVVTVQDAAVALHVYMRARELGIGIEVEV